MTLIWIRRYDWRVSDDMLKTFYETICERFKITYCISRGGFYLHDAKNPYRIGSGAKPLYALDAAKRMAQTIVDLEEKETDNGDGSKAPKGTEFSPKEGKHPSLNSSVTDRDARCFDRTRR